MNPRQRRGALLMIIAGVGAVAVFVAVLSYVSSVRAQVGDFRTVLQLTEKVKVNEPVTASMVETTEVPKRWLSGTFITDTAKLSGKVAADTLPKGSYLQSGMVTDAPKLRHGQREIAILIDAETGVAGKVQPGSLVDIYATFQGNGQTQKSCAVLVLANTRVVDVGDLTTERANEGGNVEVSKVVPVTFALSPEDSLNLTYAEAFAGKVRLALVGPGAPEKPKESSVCTQPNGDSGNDSKGDGKGGGG